MRSSHSNSVQASCPSNSAFFVTVLTPGDSLTADAARLQNAAINGPMLAQLLYKAPLNESHTQVPVKHRFARDCLKPVRLQGPKKVKTSNR